MKILATSTAPFDFDPPAGVEVVSFDPREPVPAEHLDADAAIVEGGGGAGITHLAREASNLTWVQTLAAGPDGVLTAGFGDQVRITNGRGFHDETVSELALALALASIYRFPEMGESQRERRWEQSRFGGWRALQSPDRVATLIGTRVVVWGFGSIGATIARKFTAMGAQVRGLATSAGTRHGFTVGGPDDLPEFLGWAQVLVMVLPAEDTTDKALNAERLALLPPGALVVNVGRGTTIDEDALVEALTAGRLGGAALDVTAVEPTPADSPLWDAPGVILTPHVAGGRAVGSNEFLHRQLAHLAAGEPLENLVAR